MSKAPGFGEGGGLLRHLRGAAVAYGVLLISLFFTGLAWYYVHEDVSSQSRVRFDETVRATQEAIDRRADSYLDAIFGARSLFFASNSVSRSEWRSYVDGIEPLERYSGLQALYYARRVDPGERRSFFREGEGRGLPGLRPDLEPGGERRAYFPVTFIGPADEANDSLLGYDFYTDPAHREAMNRARDTGLPMATSRVYVLTEAGPGSSADLSLRPGFVVYLPIYRGESTPETGAARREKLDGFVAGAFSMRGMLRDIFEGSFDPSIDFEVYDGAQMSPESRLYDDDGIRRAGDRDPSVLTSESRIEVAGREWSLYFAALPGFRFGGETRLPAFVLFTGVAVSLLLFGITWMLVRSRLSAESVSGQLEETNRRLERANHELEAFSHSVSHDLRAPLRSIDGFSQIVLEDYAGRLDEEGADYLRRIRHASQRMGELIDDLLELSRVSRGTLQRERVDLSQIARNILEEFREMGPDREVEVEIQEGLVTTGDARLLTVALENLLGNAWKFTGKKKHARIELGAAVPHNGLRTYYVRDNGAGFDMAYAGKLFGAFQRLHRAEEFEGTGIGLATVQRIIRRHGGRIWAEGVVGEGATFYFTLPEDGPPPESPKVKAEVTL